VRAVTGFFAYRGGWEVTKWVPCIVSEGSNAGLGTECRVWVFDSQQ
jgi:hypothetical protein